MSSIREIAHRPWHRGSGSKPEMDPLTESDALLEAQVLDIQVDALRGMVAVLFEMRIALQIREGNTGLLVAHQVTDFSWRAERRSTSRTAWTVTGSEPSISHSEFGLRVDMFPHAELVLRAGSGAFFSGNVPNIPEIPDYGLADDSRLESMIASWDSEFVPLHAVFLDANPDVGGI